MRRFTCPPPPRSAPRPAHPHPTVAPTAPPTVPQAFSDPGGNRARTPPERCRGAPRWVFFRSVSKSARIGGPLRFQKLAAADTRWTSPSRQKEGWTGPPRWTSPSRQKEGWTGPPRKPRRRAAGRSRRTVRAPRRPSPRGGRGFLHAAAPAHKPQPALSCAGPAHFLLGGEAPSHAAPPAPNGQTVRPGPLKHI